MVQKLLLDKYQELHKAQEAQRKQLRKQVYVPTCAVGQIPRAAQGSRATVQAAAQGPRGAAQTTQKQRAQ